MSNMLMITVFNEDYQTLAYLTIPVEINVQDLEFFTRNEIAKVVENWKHAHVFFSDNVTTSSVGRIHN